MNRAVILPLGATTLPRWIAPLVLLAVGRPIATRSFEREPR